MVKTKGRKKRRCTDLLLGLTAILESADEVHHGLVLAVAK
jgi:hypothetical protein